MPTILLVEDNLDNRTIYRVILEHNAFDVLEAEDGREGVSMAQDRVPHLILMDISIPGIDGYEATRILKADTRTRHIPIIALTAHAMDGDQERALAAGADAYLTKPIEPRRVVSEVQRILGSVRETEQDGA